MQINWNQFVRSLDRTSLRNLNIEVWDYIKELDLQDLKTRNIILTDIEKRLIDANRKIDAIKSIRSRTNLGLSAAKLVVDLGK